MDVNILSNLLGLLPRTVPINTRGVPLRFLFCFMLLSIVWLLPREKTMKDCRMSHDLRNSTVVSLILC